MPLKKILFIHRPEGVSVSDADCTLITNLETFLSIDMQLIYRCMCAKDSRVLSYMTYKYESSWSLCVRSFLYSNFQGPKKCP